jgi:hypothetical protein
VAFTFGEKGMQLYLDGELVAQRDYTGGLQGNYEPLVIGGSLWVNHYDGDDLTRLHVVDPFDGHIDEFAFYDQQLSMEEIGALLTDGPAWITTEILIPPHQDPEAPVTNPAISQPVSYWGLNETEGTAVTDAAGTRQDGQVFGHVDLDESGPHTPFGAGTAAEFDGCDDDYIAAPHDSSYEMNQGTVQLWFNTERTWGDQALFSKDHSGFQDGGHLSMHLDGDRLIVRLQSETESYFVESKVRITRNDWHHVAFTFGDDGMRLYLDGMLVDTNAYGGGISANHEPTIIGGTLKWNCGDSADLGALDVDQPFDGRIDEVAVFDRVLSRYELRQLVSRGVPGVWS